ncbi:MAG TPA: type III pantothenate kinase [Gammaproteobacteria bacterium]|nr:type III pantothenate kinase [Gammaproteobacteria bacterium]
MNLLIDLGNSRIKWAWADGTTLREQGAARYAGRPLAAVLEQMASDGVVVERAVVASVAARTINDELSDWLAEHYRLTATLVRAEAAAFGVTNAYAEPGRLGADRWAALIGARQRTTDAVCVVDCGTAITIDMLDAGGRHRGGLIGPGIMTMRRALYGAAAGISDEGEGLVTPLASDTRSAVTAGTVYAAAAFVDRVHSELEREWGRMLRCLITGGEAATLQPLLRMKCKPAPDLVLEGLAVIAKGSGLSK